MSSPEATGDDAEVETAIPQAVSYTCKVCRAPLFTSEQLEGHQTSQQGFSYRKQRGQMNCTLDLVKDCMSLFLADKLDW